MKEIENAIENAIETGNYRILFIIIGIAVLQVLITTWLGERTKRSIESEYAHSLEKFKDELLRRKTIFEEQVCAFKAFSSIKYKIYPEKNYHEMEWEDAIQYIALGFSGHYQELKLFLLKYSAILPKNIKNKIEQCWYTCSNGKLEVSIGGVTNKGFELAEELWDTIEKTESQFRMHLKIDST